MINKIKFKLVIGYTLAIIAVMTATTLAGYVALEHITITSNRKSLLTYLETETHEALDSMSLWKNPKKVPTEIRKFTAHKLAFNNFVYWVNARGEFLIIEELDNKISESVRNSVKKWKYPPRKIKDIFINDPTNDSSWHFIMSSSSVYDGDTFLGKIFVGTNLSPLDTIASKYFDVAVSIILGVSILAFFVGNFFASKAIYPLKIAMKTQKDFIGDASHELRTPLSVLLSSVDMIEVKTKDKPTLKNMKSEILNMRSLVNSLLVLARAENISDRAHFSKFNLSRLLISISESMQIIAAEKGIRIETEIDHNMRVLADETDIRNLVNVLLDNAVKYSGDGKLISLKASRQINVIKISVEDHGIGIKPEDIDKIFARFYRVDKARSRAQGSFGLGLSLAKNIVEKHKGTIEVTSEYKKSSTFVAMLPIGV